MFFYDAADFYMTTGAAGDSTDHLGKFCEWFIVFVRAQIGTSSDKCNLHCSVRKDDSFGILHV